MFPIIMKEVQNAVRAGLGKVELLRSTNNFELGSGAFATVFASTSLTGKAIKVSTGKYTDWGYLAFLKAIRAYGKENRWLPRIEKVTIYRDFLGRIAVITVLERLVDVPYHDRLRSMFQESCAAISSVAYRLADPTHARALEPNFEWVLDTPDLVEALTLIVNTARKYKVGLDMHNGNFMSRNQCGELVITDPMACAEEAWELGAEMGLLGRRG